MVINFFDFNFNHFWAFFECVLFTLWHICKETLCWGGCRKMLKFQKKLPKLFQFCLFVNNFVVKRAIIQMAIIQQDFQGKNIHFFKVIWWWFSETRVWRQIHADTWFFTLLLKWNLFPLLNIQGIFNFNRTTHWRTVAFSWALLKSLKKTQKS